MLFGTVLVLILPVSSLAWSVSMELDSSLRSDSHWQESRNTGAYLRDSFRSQVLIPAFQVLVKGLRQNEEDDRVFKKDDPRLKYLGTTGRTAHNRSREHQEGYTKRKSKNALWKHWSIKHKGEIQIPVREAFEMTLLTSHKSNLHRLATEALMIKQSIPNTLMNSKSEWSKNKLIRQTTTQQNV